MAPAKDLTETVLRHNLERAVSLSVARSGPGAYYHEELRECLARAAECVAILSALEGVTPNANT